MRGSLSRPLRLGVLVLSLALAMAPHAFADTVYGTPRLLPFQDLLFARGMTVDRNGYVIVADGVWRNFVVDLSPAGVQRIIRPYWNDDFNQRDVVVDADNYLYVSTAQGVFKTTPDRFSTTQFRPPGFQFPAYTPWRLALDGVGNIYAIDGGSWRVLKIDLVTFATTVVAFPALLPGYAGGGPDGLAADAAGNVFVSDTFNNRVLEWSPGVGSRTILDDTIVSLPRGLALDAAGNLIIADSGNGRVLKLTPGGTVTTLPLPVSSWSGAYQGDVGGVISVAVDAAGSIYSLEQGNSHVQVISPASPQSITFTSTAPGDAAVGGTYVVAATGGGSGNAVTFSIDAASAGSCTLSGTTVSFAHTGTCVIDANQAGSFTYASAPQTQQSFSIGKATPTVTWNQPAGIGYGTSLGSAQLNATASVAGSFAYTPPAGAILGAGTQSLSVQFTPADAANWNGASANTTIDVSKAPQIVSFTSNPTGAAVGQTYAVAVSGGGSVNPVVLSLDPSTTPGACTLAGSVVTYVAVGTCVIDANQAGDANYFAAPQAQQSVSIVNTGTGSNVPVTPTDTTTGAPAPVNLNFSNVTGGGTSSVTSTTSGPPPPTGFKLGAPPTYYNISTTATFSGPIQVCINYASASYHNPSSLRLFHNANGTWVDITTSNDTVAQVICGSTPSLSPFVALESQYAATVQSPIAADGSSVFQSNRGSVPVKFTATFDGSSTCALPPAQIAVTRLSGSAPGVVNADVYSTPSDNGMNFRNSGCQYVYNLGASALGAGTYRADIILSGATVGSATFGLK